MNGRVADEGDMPRARQNPRVDDDPFGLDDALVDQLLDAVDFGSLPSSYQPLAHVLATARGPATEAELAGGLDAVALFRSQFATGSRVGRSGPARRRRRHLRACLAAGALSVVTATGVAAATGSLPNGVQRVAAEVLSKIGITVPDGSPRSHEHPTNQSLPIVESSVPAETTVRDNTAVGTSSAGDATGVGPGVVERRPGVSAATSDGVDPGVSPENPLDTPADPPTTAGSPAIEPVTAAADPPVTAGSPPFEPVPAAAEPTVTASSAPVEPTNAPPSSVLGSAPIHPSGPPLDNEPGPPPDIEPGLPVDIQPGPPLDIQPGPPLDIQPGPPLDIQPGPPTNDSPATRSAASLPPSNPAGSPSGNR